MFQNDLVNFKVTISAKLSVVSSERSCCKAVSAQRDRDDLCSGGDIFSRP